MSTSLSASAAFASVSSVVYFGVGRLLGRREVRAGAARAHAAFRAWWFGVALSTAITAFIAVLGVLGAATVGAVTALTLVDFAIVCLALWGLLYYLVYLYSGRTGAWLWIAAAYVAYWLFLVWLILQADPVGVDVGAWSVQLEYRDDLEGDPLAAIALALLVMPQIIGALAYLSLFFRLEDATARYRVMVVSISILIWFGSVYAGALGGLGAEAWWQILSRLVGLAAALAILAAYLPPPLIRNRWGVRSLREDSA